MLFKDPREPCKIVKMLFRPTQPWKCSIQFEICNNFNPVLVGNNQLMLSGVEPSLIKYYYHEQLLV
jgi:hypothetical protein